MPQDFDMALQIAYWLSTQTGANVAMEMAEDALLLHYYKDRPPVHIAHGTVTFPVGSEQRIVDAYLGR